MKFFNPFDDIRVTRNNLPHWQQLGATYFVTFRMADSLPKNLLLELESRRRAWLENHPAPLSAQHEADYHKQFSSRIDQWLDDGYGSCVLKRIDFRSVIAESLFHFNMQRYDLISFVIMPNHFHGLFMLNPECPLERVIFSWKRRTSGVINRSLGVQGSFWQSDYFDRIIRDHDHLQNVIRYIRRNPTKARLNESEYTLWESEFAKAM